MHWALQDSDEKGSTIQKSNSSVQTFLTLELGKCVIALEIGSVREILDPQHLSPVPGAPDVVLGCFDWRGKMVLALDGRQVLGVSKSDTAADLETRFVVAVDPHAFENNTEERETDATFALAVDRVRSVANFEASIFAAPPGEGQGICASYVTGMARVGEETFQRIEMGGTLQRLGLSSI
jgi:chemotaxis signal transduction protein